MCILFSTTGPYYVAGVDMSHQQAVTAAVPSGNDTGGASAAAAGASTPPAQYFHMRYLSCAVSDSMETVFSTGILSAHFNCPYCVQQSQHRLTPLEHR